MSAVDQNGSAVAPAAAAAPQTPDNGEGGRAEPGRLWHGHLRLRAEAVAGGRTRLGDQAFRAPFHLSKPYWDEAARTLILQVVNPTAGILAGDRLVMEMAVETGARLLVTTPSASRVFRMRDGQARSTQRLRVAEGGWLEMWPEPLVPHAGSHFEQRTEIVAEAGAGLWFCDLLMPGRVAHGELWAWRRLLLETRLELAGALVLRERFDQTGPELAALAALAGAAEGACFANLLFVPVVVADASAWLPQIHALQENDVRIGASVLRDRRAWSIKFVAPDGDRLRRTLRRLRHLLTPLAPALAADPRKL